MFFISWYEHKCHIGFENYVSILTDFENFIRIGRNYTRNNYVDGRGAPDQHLDPWYFFCHFFLGECTSDSSRIEILRTYQYQSIIFQEILLVGPKPLPSNMLCFEHRCAFIDGATWLSHMYRDAKNGNEGGHHWLGSPRPYPNQCRLIVDWNRKIQWNMSSINRRLFRNNSECVIWSRFNAFTSSIHGPSEIPF